MHREFNSVQFRHAGQFPGGRRTGCCIQTFSPHPQGSRWAGQLTCQCLDVNVTSNDWQVGVPRILSVGQPGLGSLRSNHQTKKIPYLLSTNIRLLSPQICSKQEQQQQNLCTWVGEEGRLFESDACTELSP